MAANINGGCYLALQRSVSKKLLLKRVFSQFKHAEESVIVCRVAIAFSDVKLLRFIYGET